MDIRIDLNILAKGCVDPEQWHLHVTPEGWILILDARNSGFFLGSIPEFDPDNFNKLKLAQSMENDDYYLF